MTLFLGEWGSSHSEQIRQEAAKSTCATSDRVRCTDKQHPRTGPAWVSHDEWKPSMLTHPSGSSTRERRQRTRQSSPAAPDAIDWSGSHPDKIGLIWAYFTASRANTASTRGKALKSRPYDKGGAVGGSRQVVIGKRDGAFNFGMRYYEIAPGGQSLLRPPRTRPWRLRSQRRRPVDDGLGRCIEIGAGDIIYIPPNEQHQFENTGHEPFCFLCAVPPRD